MHATSVCEGFPVKFMQKGIITSVLVCSCASYRRSSLYFFQLFGQVLGEIVKKYITIFKQWSNHGNVYSLPRDARKDIMIFGQD